MRPRPLIARARRPLACLATLVVAAPAVAITMSSAHVTAAPPPPPNCMVPARGSSPAPRGDDWGRTFLAASGRFVTIEMPNGGSGPFVERHDLVTDTTVSVAVPVGGVRDVSADGRFVLYLENAYAGGPARFVVLDMVAGSKTTVTLAAGWSLRADYTGYSDQRGHISDDGQRVVVEARATGQSIVESVVVLVSTGSVEQVTDAVVSGGSKQLLAASGDATRVAVQAPGESIEVFDTVSDTSLIVPDIDTSAGISTIDFVGTSQYLVVGMGAQTALYDADLHVTTPVGTPTQGFIAASENGRYLLFADVSNGGGTERRGVVYDRQTGTSARIGELSGLNQLPVDVADDGQTVAIRQYPGSLGVWTRPITWITRVGLPDLRFGFPIEIPIGGVRSAVLEGAVPDGTTISFGDASVDASIDEVGGRVVLAVQAAADATPGTHTMTMTTPGGYQLEAGSFHFQFTDTDLTPVHSVVHPGETTVLEYEWRPPSSFTPTTLDIGQSAGGAAVMTGTQGQGTIATTVSMTAGAPRGLRNLVITGSDADDYLEFLDAAVVREFQGEFHPVTPARIVDTRSGVGGRLGALIGGEPVSFPVAGTGGVPATGVDAIVANVTVDAPNDSSFLTVWPADETRPTASNLNFVRGQVVPNLVTVKVSSDGRISVYNNTGVAHVIIDVVGWYSSATQTNGGSAFVPVAPSRLLDTREDGAPIGQQETLDLFVAEPGSGISAVVLNVTVTEATAPSYLSVIPSGTAPTTSSLNFVAGQTVPNLVVVPVGPDGAVSFYNNTGSAHVIADIFGLYDAGEFPIADGQLSSISPHRALDTRLGIGAPSAIVTPGARLELDLRNMVPPEATSVVMNVTVTEPTGPGFVTVWPSDLEQPGTSNLNYVAGLTVPNLVVVPIGLDGSVRLSTNGHPAHLVADVAGWYGPA